MNQAQRPSTQLASSLRSCSSAPYGPRCARGFDRRHLPSSVGLHVSRGQVHGYSRVESQLVQGKQGLEGAGHGVLVSLYCPVPDGMS